MKKVYADANRDLQQKTIYEGNGFSYEYIVDYPRNLPPEVANGCIPGGCVGPDDTLYVVVRAKESMIAVIGADGNFVKCIGKGQLGDNVHFVYYTPQNTFAGGGYKPSCGTGTDVGRRVCPGFRAV